MAEKKNEVTDDDFHNAVFEDGGNLVIDLSGIAEAKFEPIPKGIYEAEIDSCEYGLSNNSGAPMFTLGILIVGGDHNGRKLTTYLSFSQKALPFTKATINRFAPELLVGPFKPEEIAGSGALLGRAVRVRVTVEDYQGEPRSRVSQLLAASGNTPGGSGSAAAGKGFF